MTNTHDAPTGVQELDALRQRLAKNPRSIEARVDLAAGLREARDVWGALVELYRAHCFNRRREDVVAAIRDLADETDILPFLRATIRGALLCGGEPPSAADTLRQLNREARLDLLRLLFEQCDAVDVHVFPNYPGRDGELNVRGLDLDASSLRAFAEARKSTKEPYPFQTELLESGWFAMPSPLTGAPVVSNGSLAAGTGRPFVCYHFNDAQPFLVLAQPFEGSLAAIYFPARNVIVGEQSFRHYQRAFAQLKALIVEFADDTATHLGSPEPRPLGLLYGAMNHIGHAAANEYAGMHQCSADGRLASVDLVLKGPSSFLPHDVMFPELAEKPVISVRSPAETYAAVLQARMTVVRPTCGFPWFSRGLTERIAATATALGAATAPRPEEAAGRHPLIWFEIRTNDRCWIGQAEGIAAIGNALAEDYPGIGVVVAGWSKPLDGVLTPHDEKMLRTDREVAEKIRASLNAEIPVFDLTGLPTPEKFLWATKVDFFAGSYSTGLIYALYTGLKPGVIHCTRKYLEHLTRTEGKIAFVEAHPELYIVAPDRITYEENRSHEIANYDLDWRAIHDGLRALLGKFGTGPGRA